jgi:hypothetical protein
MATSRKVEVEGRVSSGRFTPISGARYEERRPMNMLKVRPTPVAVKSLAVRSAGRYPSSDSIEEPGSRIKVKSTTA